MNYFKYININEYKLVLEKSRKFVLETYNTYLEKHESLFQLINWKSYVNYCPEILTAFSDYKLEPVTGYIYIIFDQKLAPIHIDYISNFVNKCRINIPIFNCEHSKTLFYRKINNAGVVTPQMVKINKGLSSSSYIRYDENDSALEKVDEVIVDKPTILRVQEPHRVIIDHTHIPRVVLTIQTRKDPVYLLEEVVDETC